MRESALTQVSFRAHARSVCPIVVALGLVAAGSAGAVTITGWVGGKAAVPQVVTAAGNCPGTSHHDQRQGSSTTAGSPA